MTIQAVGANRVNTNINTNLKREIKQVEKPKEGDSNFDDGEKKICAALSGLAVLSLAGIGIAMALRKGKTVPPKDTTNTVKGAQNIASSLSQTGAKALPATNTFAAAQKDVSKPVQQINGQAGQSINHSTKKKSINGVNGKDKSAARNNAASIGNKRMEAEARANMLKKNVEVQKTLADASQSINISVGEIKNAGQGIKSAASIQALDKKAEMAQNAAQNISDKVQKMEDIANEVPTHKNIIRARAAQNKAARAQIDADRVQEKVDKKKEQIMSDALRKEQNIQKTINNTTPERLLEGQRKMEANAQKTSARAIQRKADRTVNKPGYQRALRQFQNYSPAKLQSVINSNKSSNIEKIVAQDLLAIMDKI